jgi:hypothetical protein
MVLLADLAGYLIEMELLRVDVAPLDLLAVDINLERVDGLGDAEPSKLDGLVQQAPIANA